MSYCLQKALVGNLGAERVIDALTLPVPLHMSSVYTKCTDGERIGLAYLRLYVRRNSFTLSNVMREAYGEIGDLDAWCPAIEQALQNGAREGDQNPYVVIGYACKTGIDVRDDVAKGIVRVYDLAAGRTDLVPGL